MAMEWVEIAPEVVAAAAEAQLRDIQYDKGAWILGICLVCGGNHPTYKCCDRCNYDTHTCHFCGDGLGHYEVSACYLLMDVEEGKVVPDVHVLRMWVQQATSSRDRQSDIRNG